MGSTSKRQSLEEQEQARETLRGMLRPGDRVYTILRHVSRSGMQRVIDVYIMEDGRLRWVGGLVAKAIGDRYDGNRRGLVVGGVGMDMGFHIAYSLGYALYGSGGWTCTGKGCPSSDHSNGDRDYTPHQHTDGGYAFKHEWL